MRLFFAGISHKTASLVVRERLAFVPAEVGPALEVLTGLPGVREAVLLSTCNRTEAYTWSDAGLTRTQLGAALAEARGLPGDTILPRLSWRAGTEAAQHALRVAAGLESMVVGEAQILSQVRRALDLAQTAGTAGPVLNRLMQVAIATGRRVRRETGLSTRAPSVPRAALELCRQQLGTVRGRTVLVVGAGEIGALVVKVFAAAGARISAVANRSMDAAKALAGRTGALATSLDDVADAIRDADIAVVTVGAVAPVLSAQACAVAVARARPLHVIDLGTPRGVDPAVADLPGVRVHNLDALASATGSAAIPDEVLKEANRIVEDALLVFCRWLDGRVAAPVIAALQRHGQQIADEEAARARLRDLDPQQRDAVRAAMRAAVARLLHAPIVRLKTAAGEDGGQAVSLAAHLFGLPAGQEDDGR